MSVNDHKRNESVRKEAEAVALILQITWEGDAGSD